MRSKFCLRRIAYTTLICELLIGMAASAAFADNFSSADSAGSSSLPSTPRVLQAQISHTDAMSRSELGAAAAVQQDPLAAPLKPMAAPVVTPNYSASAQNAQVALQSNALQSNVQQSNVLQANAQNSAFNLQAAA